jgi:serine/threonine protein kinase
MSIHFLNPSSTLQGIPPVADIAIPQSAMRDKALTSAHHARTQLSHYLRPWTRDVLEPTFEWLETKISHLRSTQNVTEEDIFILDQRIQQVVARITFRENRRSEQIERNKEVSERLSDLAGCIKRLNGFVSSTLYSMYIAGEQLLADGRVAIDNGSFLDAKIKDNFANREWIDSVRIEHEITTCTQALANKIILSTEATQQKAVGDFFTTTAKIHLINIVCLAVRKGHSAFPNFPLKDNSLAKFSCHFTDSHFPEIRLRCALASISTKKFFKVIHLNGGHKRCVEVYVKADRGLRHSNPIDFAAMQHRLFKDATVSSLLHSSAAPETSKGRELRIRHLLEITQIFHKKKPTSFKGVVMEYCDLLDASTLPLPVSQNLKQRLMLAAQLALALQEIHERHLCHLDVKAENTFLKTEEDTVAVRLGDFEFTTEQETVMNQLVGTYIFLPPEVLTSRQWIVRPSVDMWSFGLTLLELTRGVEANLYSSRISEEIFTQPYQYIKAQWIKIHEQIMTSLNASDPLDHLIVDLLHFNDPQSRPSALQTVDRLLDIIITL